MKSPCHICGSTNYPSSTTTCPICIGEDEAERDDYDGDEIDLNDKVNLFELCMTK